MSCNNSSVFFRYGKLSFISFNCELSYKVFNPRTSHCLSVLFFFFWSHPSAVLTSDKIISSVSVSTSALLSTRFHSHQNLSFPPGEMASSQNISPKPLTKLYPPFQSLACSSQGLCNAGISLVSRQPDKYICLEKRLPERLIHSGAARFEIALLRRLKHFNIVRYLDAYIDTQNLHRSSASLYMEYCNRGSLADEIDKRLRNGKWFEEKEIWHIFTQLVNAVAYIQYGLSDAISYPQEGKNSSWMGVIHRDIKPENIFLQTSPTGGRPIVLLGDFGAAVQQDRHGIKLGQGFSMPGEWASPEWPNFSYASDVWLVGSVMQECCRLNVISRNSKVIFAGVGSRYSRYLNDAVAQFMHSDPSKRPRLDRWAPNLASLKMMAERGNGR